MIGALQPVSSENLPLERIDKAVENCLIYYQLCSVANTLIFHPQAGLWTVNAVAQASQLLEQMDRQTQ